MRAAFRAFPALALLSAPLALPAQTAPPSPFGERVDVNIVNVEVYVTDKDGNPVDGLGRGDFEVREDGKPVPVANFQSVRAASPSPSAPAPAAVAGAAADADHSAAPDPLHLVVYVQNTFLMPSHRNRVLQQLRDFLSRLPPEAEVMLATEDPDLHIRQPFTRDRAVLARAVEAIETLGASGTSHLSARKQALDQILTIRDVNSSKWINEPCLSEIAQPAHAYAGEVRGDVLRALGAMTVLVNSLSGLPGRKALLLVSDGMPVTPGEEAFQFLGEICNPSGTSGNKDVEIGGNGVLSGVYDARQAALDAQQYSAASAFKDLAAHANAQRVTIYGLQASGLEGNTSAGAEWGVNERIQQLPTVQALAISNLQGSMTSLASDTGGRAILNANDLRHDFDRLQEDFSTYYSLAYSPPHNGDGRDHRIEVRVKRSGLRARYRQSYRDKPPLERMVDRTLASLFYGVEDNPLDVEMKIGAMAPVDKQSWMVPVRLRIPLFKITMVPTDTTFEGKIRLLVAIRDPSGKRPPLRQAEVPISIPKEKVLMALGQYYLYEVKLTLEPGEQHVAVAVRDEATTTTSFLARTLQVGTAGAQTGSPAL
jgi:VWFA-related protein